MGIDQSSMDSEQTLELIPRKRYRPIMKKAADRLGALTDDADLFDMLFKKDEQEWLRKQYKSRTSH